MNVKSFLIFSGRAYYINPASKQGDKINVPNNYVVPLGFRLGARRSFIVRSPCVKYVFCWISDQLLLLFILVRFFFGD